MGRRGRGRGRSPGGATDEETNEKAEVKAAYVDETLADPIAEKLRQQKLVEEADLKAAIELFGSEEDFKDFNLETFEPKNAKDFEKLATASVKKHFYEHRNSPHYKVALKTFIKVALSEFPGADVKEIESHAAVIRTKRLRKKKRCNKRVRKRRVGVRRSLSTPEARKETQGWTIISTIIKTWTISTISCRLFY